MKTAFERLKRLQTHPDLSAELSEELVELERDLKSSAEFDGPQSKSLISQTFASDEFQPVDLSSVALDPTHTSLEQIDVSEVSEVDLDSQIPLMLADRYEDLGLITVGGMGEIRRVRDRDLNRVAVMKVIRVDRQQRHLALMRFVEEAQISAQLAHPGIPSVHELGRFADGRLYFTMREVRGRTLKEVMNEVHGVFDGDVLRESATGWSMRGLIEALEDVCSTLAFAHARGVVHRDLKPENIMVGDFGEVQVLDWGIAKVAGRTITEAPDGDDPLESLDVNQQREHTRAGTVMGTAAYMAPEQVRGEIERIQPATDVFALGVILYEILTGQAPFAGASTLDILLQILEGPQVPIDDFEHVPEALADICNRALGAEPSQRYPSARQMGEAIEDWLEGTARRERAGDLLRQAGELRREIDEINASAAYLERRARDQLKDISPGAPVEDKEASWEMEDRVRKLRRKLARREVKYVNLLRSALAHAPTLQEPKRLLADYYREQHEIAERLGNEEDAEEMKTYLESYDDGRYAAYLRGHGRLSLQVDRAGARASLFRFRSRSRRLMPEFVCELGELPLEDVELARGSYLVRVNAPGAIQVEYPIQIEREGHWSSAPPGWDAARPVHLPAAGSIGATEAYVPAGWFNCGGDPQAPQSLDLKRVWIDGFVIQRFPVTHREYLLFLNSLVAQGREEEALTHAPSRSGGVAAPFGPPAYERTDSGMFVLPDGSSDLAPDHPVTLVDWYAARAYAQWLRRRTELPWRLPSEFEWEKAARGVDGRLYPWGDFLDPTWCAMLDSQAVAHTPVPVQSYPVDQSPYGVRGMAGNVRTWCRETFQPAEANPSVPSSLRLDDTVDSLPDHAEARVFRGGAWYLSRDQCRAAARDGNSPTARFKTVGIRLVRPLTG